MPAHTPGPWHVGGIGKAVVFALDGYAVCNANVYHGRRAADTEHNARLIAAAPDLLALVQDALTGWEAELVGVPNGQWPAQEARVARARAAIAKATGGTE